MLTLSDLLNRNTIPEWSDISLPLYKNFSENILLKRTFRYYTKNNQVLSVKFTEWGIYHMLAIQHIDNRIRKEVFFSEIDNGLDFPVFRAERAKRKRLMDYKDRIRMFACVYQILKAGHCFYVPNGQIPASDVKVDYIIYQLIDGKGSNLGIRYVDDEYIPLTLLINRAINPNEIIQKLTRVNMEKLEIIENQQVIETITYQEG